jgi:hypothetical protein
MKRHQKAEVIGESYTIENDFFRMKDTLSDLKLPFTQHCAGFIVKLQRKMRMCFDRFGSPTIIENLVGKKVKVNVMPKYYDFRENFNRVRGININLIKVNALE